MTATCSRTTGLGWWLPSGVDTLCVSNPPFLYTLLLSLSGGRKFDSWRQCKVLICIANLYSFRIYCQWSSNLFCFATTIGSFAIITIMNILDLTFKFPTHSHLGAARELSKMDIFLLWSGSMVTSGEQSPAMVLTYQVLPPAVRRTWRWTLCYDA